MTIGINDFDAAKAVVDQLSGMEKERQERILRWVAESLGLHSAPVSARSPSAAGQHAPPTSIEPSQILAPHARPTGLTRDIKSFVDAKRPKSDVQFAAVVAYYYQFEAPIESRKESIDANGLLEAARLARRRRPQSAKATLNNAKTLGYLDSADRGQFCINSVGENLVAMTLPGDGPDAPATGRKRATARPRKRAGTAKTRKPAKKK